MPSPTVWKLRRGLRWGFAGLCLGACAAEEPPDGRVDFVFEVDERELCSGTLAHLDGYVERVFAFLNDAPGDFTVPVHVVASVSCAGQADATGCYHANERRVTVNLDEGSRFRPMAVLRHEVTHAVVHAAWGQSVPFFEEGLAESLSRSEAVTMKWTPKPRSILHMLDRPADQVDYEAAALFTRYLIDRVGISHFRVIYQGIRAGARDEIAATIEGSTGEEFDALEADFLSGAPRCAFAVDLCDPEDALELPAATSWSTTVAASCLAPEFYGSQSSEGMVAASQVRLKLQGAGRYRVHFVDDAEWDAKVELTRCGDCGEQFVRQVWNGTELELDAGVYTLEIVVVPFASYVELGLEYLGP